MIFEESCSEFWSEKQVASLTDSMVPSFLLTVNLPWKKCKFESGLLHLTWKESLVELPMNYVVDCLLKIKQTQPLPCKISYTCSKIESMLHSLLKYYIDSGSRTIWIRGLLMVGFIYILVLQSTYSCSISHILENEVFCFGRLGSYGWKKIE